MLRVAPRQIKASGDMVEQNVVGESDKVTSPNQNARLKRIVECVVLDVDLGNGQTAALDHGFDCCRRRSFERLRRQTLVFVPINQFGLGCESTDAVGGDAA